MSQISTHILDTYKGLPAGGVTVLLEQASSTSHWITVGTGTTDSDGRISSLLKEDILLEPGTYRLTFETAHYFSSQNIKSFYPFVQVVFEVSDKRHIHVPLLISPFGYTTYRGS